MSADVRVTGLDRLVTGLRAAGAELADMPAANRAAGALVARAAAARAPKRSGRLASSITADPHKGGVSIDSTLPYAGPVHWGWPARRIKPNTFLVDAARATESTWTDTYTEATQAALDKVAGA